MQIKKRGPSGQLPPGGTQSLSQPSTTRQLSPLSRQQPAPPPSASLLSSDAWLSLVDLDGVGDLKEGEESLVYFSLLGELPGRQISAYKSMLVFSSGPERMKARGRRKG